MPWDRSNLPAGGGERVSRPPLPSRPMPPVARAGGTRGRTLSQNGKPGLTQPPDRQAIPASWTP